MCKIKDADICIKCEVVVETSEGDGLRGAICSKCKDAFNEKLKSWKETGLYTEVKP